MSIKTRVIGSFLVILSLFFGITIFNYIRIRESNNRLRLVNELFLPLSRLIVQLQGNIYGYADDMRRFFFGTEQNAENSSFSKLTRELNPYIIQNRFQSIEILLNKNLVGDAKIMISEVSKNFDEIKSIFTQFSSTFDQQKFESLYLSLRTHLQTISKRVDDECQNITLSAQQEGRENLFSSLFLSAIASIFGVVVLLLSHRMLMPFPALINSIKKISDGDFHQSLKVDSHAQDEVASLAREYNRMLTALKDRDEKIMIQQKELLQAERLAAIGQLSAEIVHEIRNPLNSISLNIDWIKSEINLKDSEVEKTLKSIAKEVDRLNQITESYLVRAKISSDEPQRTAVNELFTEMIDFSKEEDHKKNIKITTHFSEHEVWVHGDKPSLKQAFFNLLKNAREAMPGGGEIKIATEVLENVYRIRITDNGHGMNEVTRRKTFHPFFTTKQNGTGIGLALTKNIIEGAMGSIDCESQMGTGTTFTVQFPI